MLIEFRAGVSNGKVNLSFGRSRDGLREIETVLEEAFVSDEPLKPRATFLSKLHNVLHSLERPRSAEPVLDYKALEQRPLLIPKEQQREMFDSIGRNIIKEDGRDNFSTSLGWTQRPIGRKRFSERLADGIRSLPGKWQDTKQHAKSVVDAYRYSSTTDKILTAGLALGTIAMAFILLRGEPVQAVATPAVGKSPVANLAGKEGLGTSPVVGHIPFAGAEYESKDQSERPQIVDQPMELADAETEIVVDGDVTEQNPEVEENEDQKIIDQVLSELRLGFPVTTQVRDILGREIWKENMELYTKILEAVDQKYGHVYLKSSQAILANSERYNAAQVRSARRAIESSIALGESGQKPDYLKIGDYHRKFHFSPHVDEDEYALAA